MDVWEFPPTPDIRETLEWVTVVQRTYTQERRFCMRPIPRQILDFTHHGAGEPDLFLMQQRAESIGASTCWVPEWFHAVRIPTVNSGTVSIPVDATGIPAYKVGNRLIIWESREKFLSPEITSIGSGTIGFSATGMTCLTPMVAPMRTCVIQSALNVSRTTGPLVDATIGFRCDNTEDLALVGGGLSYPDYLGYPVITDRPIVRGSMNDGRELAIDEFDSVTGPTERYAKTESGVRSSMMSWRTYTRDWLYSLRVWLHGRKGQQKAFWSPTWNADAVVTKDIEGGDEYIEIDYVGFGNTQMDLGILATPAAGGGGWFVRITGSTSQGAPAGKEHLILESPFDGDVGLEAIDCVCKLHLSRFASDAVAIQHEIADQASVVVPIIEVPQSEIPESPT